MEINDIIDALFDHFDVYTIQDLADKMNVSQPTISKWKSRNSISAIKKKCRELGIYSDIFGDLSLNTTINQGNNGRAAGNNYVENEKQIKEHDFDSITVSLIEKAIKKFGSEEDFQFEFMRFLKSK